MRFKYLGLHNFSSQEDSKSETVRQRTEHCSRHCEAGIDHFYILQAQQKRRKDPDYHPDGSEWGSDADHDDEEEEEEMHDHVDIDVLGRRGNSERMPSHPAGAEVDMPHGANAALCRHHCSEGMLNPH